ncbi:hypothetical protein PUR61_29600 [Streptomyces sp. BE20]|uniref:hypothetical protein n=1 Tax=Streptomyces sp. BE20 TaxID=3002525 RepID=UPI002E75B4F3|nr:hypothetical protein [Streptomyces sp. BE20]MEE1826311.1 hypothetical protein [Streptomyces sp. BE20]
MSEEGVVVVATSGAVTTMGEVPGLMQKIRPDWRAMNLIERVRRILPVDPSSACQLLFNAAVRDLKDKILMVGVGIAGEAAPAGRRPSRPGDERANPAPVPRCASGSAHRGTGAGSAQRGQERDRVKETEALLPPPPCHVHLYP